MPYAKRLSVKAGWTFFFVAFLLVFSSSPAMACTSFAVYSQEPIYGMNFDWFYDTELKFMVLNESRYGNEFEFFSLVFDIDGNDGYSPIMSNGLFFLFRNSDLPEQAKIFLVSLLKMNSLLVR